MENGGIAASGGDEYITVNHCCMADRMSPIGLMVYPLFPL